MLKNRFFSEIMGSTSKMNGSKVVQRKILFLLGGFLEGKGGGAKVCRNKPCLKISQRQIIFKNRFNSRLEAVVLHCTSHCNVKEEKYENSSFF